MSTLLIACGGTGGHLAPGIAIAEELQDRGHSVVLLISRKQVDSALIRKYNHLHFHRAPGRAFSGGLAGRVFALLDVIHGFLFSFRLIRQHQPASVLLFGGFLSLGLGFAARLHGIPVALHEANCRPGRAVRLLKSLATRIYLPEGVSLSLAQDRVRYLGYPVRREIKACSKEVARKELGIETSGKLLLVIGGSQGAEALNRWAREQFEKLAEAGVAVYCVAGFGKVKDSEMLYRSSEGAPVRASFVAFSDQMGTVLSAADVVVSRAGAGAIAEIIRCSVPAVLIPYPYAADQHQMANAEAHEQEGAGLLVSEDQMDSLLECVLQLLFDNSRLEAYKTALERLNNNNAARLIVDDIVFFSSDQPKEAAAS